MGILNVTPDSFSDGGKYIDPERALAQAWKIQKEGADLLDIGAESTRPGSEGVSEEEEKKRLWSVLRKLKEEEYPLPISLDSCKASLVEAAIKEGLIQMVNDVQGLRDPEMVRVVKENQVPVCIMHMFGVPRSMQSEYVYEDVVSDLITFFKERLKETGLKDNVILDPGIGFGKSVKHNLQILQRLPEFLELGHPILIGASRKSFIGKTLDVDVEERLEGSLAVAAISAYQGASILRVHDVQETVRVVRMAEAIRSAQA